MNSIEFWAFAELSLRTVDLEPRSLHLYHKTLFKTINIHIFFKNILYYYFFFRYQYHIVLILVSFRKYKAWQFRNCLRPHEPYMNKIRVSVARFQKPLSRLQWSSLVLDRFLMFYLPKITLSRPFFHFRLLWQSIPANRRNCKNHKQWIVSGHRRYVNLETYPKAVA